MPDAEDSLHHSRQSSIRRPLIVALIFFTLGVYSYPALATWAKTGSTDSPPILAPDTGFYLLLSKTTTLRPHTISNPYYGIESSPNATAHLRFRLAFVLFGLLEALLGGHLWLTLFIWNLFWWGLLCWVAIWLFGNFLPDNATVLVALGLGLLLWLNFGLLKPMFAAWMHLPSLRGFEDIGLAYARPFFPQVPIPLLLFYLGLQIGVLVKQRLRSWAAMGVLQFLAFAIFPYTTLMMAGITMAATIWLIFDRPRPVPWRRIVVYGALCAGQIYSISAFRLLPSRRRRRRRYFAWNSRNCLISSVECGSSLHLQPWQPR
jgi:hypothetical protein